MKIKVIKGYKNKQNYIQWDWIIRDRYNNSKNKFIMIINKNIYRWKNLNKIKLEV